MSMKISVVDVLVLASVLSPPRYVPNWIVVAAVMSRMKILEIEFFFIFFSLHFFLFLF